MKLVPAWLVACLLTAGAALAGPQASKGDGVQMLLRRLEGALQSGQASQYLALLSPSADRERAEIFAASVVTTAATRVVVRERDRAALFGTLPGDGYQLLLEVFTEDGSRARLATWRLDVRRNASSAGKSDATESWGITNQDVITSLHGLQRLSLDPQKQYTAHNFTVASEDSISCSLTP